MKNLREGRADRQQRFDPAIILAIRSGERRTDIVARKKGLRHILSHSLLILMTFARDQPPSLRGCEADAAIQFFHAGSLDCHGALIPSLSKDAPRNDEIRPRARVSATMSKFRDKPSPKTNAATLTISKYICAIIPVRREQKTGIMPMKPLTSTASALLAILFLAASANAASFDCAQAGTEIEHMICGDEALSALDELLGDRYVRARAKAVDPKVVKTEQRAWLGDTRDACTDTACMKAAYEARIAELTKIGWMTDEKARAICERVAVAKVDGSFHATFRRLDPGEVLEIDPAPGLHGYRPGDADLDIDYDGDGKIEKLGEVGQYGGTCQLYSVSMIIDVTNGAPERNPTFDLEWRAGHQQFLVVDGEPVLARTPNDPKSVLLLDWLTPAGGVTPLCSIAIKRERRLKTVKSENPSLCRAVAENDVKLLAWSPVPEEVNRESEAAGSGERISSLLLDIDADGDDDTIAWVSYSSSAGCGYNHHWLVEMSPDLMSVTESPLNSVLIHKGPLIGAHGRWREWAPAAGSPHTGWDKPRIFMFDGKSYILGRGRSGSAVISVWGGEERTWCEYEYPALPKNSNIRHYPIKPPSNKPSGAAQ